MTTVMIADSHPVDRRKLRSLLVQYPDIEIVAETASGPEAIDAVTQQVPEVIVLDIQMPGGIGATQVLAAPPWEVPVLVMTAFNIDSYVFGAIEAGSAVIILKDSSPGALISAVRSTAHGDGALSPEIVPRVFAALRAARHTDAVAERFEGLTAREIEVIRALAEGPSSTRAMAERLFIAPTSVKSHLKRILIKLQLDSRAELVTWAFRNGISLLTEDRRPPLQFRGVFPLHSIHQVTPGGRPGPAPPQGA